MVLTSRSSFPETPAPQTGVWWLCVSVVLKARVYASLSLLLPPLCLSPAPSSLGPPHQSSYLLPSPSHPKTQQVEHRFRTLLWLDSSCPDISMTCSAQALLPAGIALGLAGAGVPGWLHLQLTFPRSPQPCSRVSSPRHPSCSGCIRFCTCSRVPPAPLLLLPQETWVGACALLTCTGLS